VTSTTSAADVPKADVHGVTAFATTHWSLIARAVDPESAESRDALEELCRTYWYPLYIFARRRGLAPAEAEDITQGFWADLLARGAMTQADQTRGRFRTFLLSAFENFRSHERARANAAKRGGGHTIISLEAIQTAEVHFRDEPATIETPESLFDRQWAMSLIEVSLASVRREYAAAGKAALFDELKVALWGGRGDVGYAEIARRLGTTEGAIKVAVHRLWQRFGDRFRAEVAKTIIDPADAADEIRYLLAAVSV
jgi:DNA-directed RNA polymerase specialized sigma24 family protein